MQKKIIIGKLSDNKQFLRKRFRIEKMGLFGSYARNTQTDESDIDLLVEFAEGQRLGLLETYELEQFFKKLLNTEKIDLVNHKYMNPVIKSEMKKSVVYV